MNIPAISPKAALAAWVMVAHVTQELWQKIERGNASQSDRDEYATAVEARDFLYEIRVRSGIAKPPTDLDREAMKAFEDATRPAIATAVCRDCWITGYKHGRAHAGT